MSYWGETWSLLSAVFWAIAVVLFRVAVRGIPAVELGLFKNFLAMLLCILTWKFLPFFENETALSNTDVLLLITSGLLGISLGDTLFLYSLNLLGASRNAILSCLFSPFVILLSFLFLGERFTTMQVLGFLLVLTGIVFAVYRTPGTVINQKNLILGTLTGVISIFFMASGMIIAKPIVTDSSPILVSWIRLAAGVAGIVLFTIASGRMRKTVQVFKGPLPWKVMFLGAFLGSYLALFTWISGFKYTTASIASILNQMSVILILLLSAIFLKERLTPLKISGAVLGFAGVTLILLNV